MRLFSTGQRAPYLGLYPSERLARSETLPDLETVPRRAVPDFDREDRPRSIVNAMREHQAMLDAIRDGLVNRAVAGAPVDPLERARHLKGFARFCDVTEAAVCAFAPAAKRPTSLINADVMRLADDLKTRQTKTLAAGIDMIMADLKESMEAPPGSIDHHTHALVLLHEHPRDPDPDEPGADWIIDAQAHRAALLGAETAVVLANYLRLLGHDACAHTATASDVDLDRLAVASGLAEVTDGEVCNPWVGRRFGLAAVTTTFELAVDSPLAPNAGRDRRARGIAWTLGVGLAKRAGDHVPFARRRYVDGAHPFETLDRVDTPTTYIDEARVARVPKRTDMFARAQFGDMGKALQAGAKGGHYARKAAPSMAQRRALGAFVLLQDGEPADDKVELPPDEAAELIKASCYFLGVDAVGISRCPPWSWYSHDARGDVIDPPHDQAISMIIDQGHETMEGASGDDWISVAQSMRAYLRFSLLGGVIARQIRRLGYSAKAHSVLDGEVLQPPLLLLAGLGEVSRIGEVILNPFLGPRLKSGAVTTDLPMTHDRPIDFGLQRFCESCNKCARECPSGAITAGPKLMFNGYEIWKSDSQKCATYRITTEGGAMCGRCMKTCPWNLEGVFKERPFRWAAMNVPAAAPWLARLDDAVSRGDINPLKKWWWDLEIKEDGGYRPAAAPVNTRGLQKGLTLKYEDQTLAVYPASLAPHPWPYPSPMNREAGIEAYQAMITADEYRARLARGETEGLAHEYRAAGESPVIQVRVASAERMTDDITVYDLAAVDGGELPAWEAGAHLDLVIAPEFLRQYSLCGNPADRSRYRIGVLREQEGRGGSALLHRIFTPGRTLFVSRPINHFPLIAGASHSILLGGGIGITPMIAMAHALHARGAAFDLHYSGRRRADMALLDELEEVPWAERVRLHVSDEGGRADLASLIAPFEEGVHLYTCGAERYMEAVMDAAERAGYPEEHRHLEYFATPERPDFVNHDFILKLARSGRTLSIPAERSATDVLQEAGVAIDVKCSDGLCGVCQCGLLAGEVEHRDLVLSAAQREKTIILCQSRAAVADGVVEVDL